MIIYISKSKTEEHFFDFELKIEAKNENLFMQLPSWRPGRYELQNFAKNIQKIIAFGENNKILKVNKTTKDCWQIEKYTGKVSVKYSYYANKMDAGNSYVDETIFYLNFVNCIPHIVGKINAPVEVFLAIPNNFKIASGLKFKLLNNFWHCKSKNFYELYDSPTIASNTICTEEYTIKNGHFYVHFIGNYQPNWQPILEKFKLFTDFQIEKMGDFPVVNYHFIFWILPTAYYHGVEHGNSTMVVLGPDIEGDNLISDILGVASHELFHTWNICKIRPKELLPYDFSNENYFDTGFIVEGVTTYLGDLFLLQAKVISFEEYLKELNAIAMRHFVKEGNAQQSLLEASMDLWMDGYSEGIPNKKVSIYNKGALVAMILDLKIRNKFNYKKSIYDLMKKMWVNFGQPNIGYKLADYILLAEEVYENSLTEYFEKCVFGNDDLLPILNLELLEIGLKIKWNNDNSISISKKSQLTLTQLNNLQKFITDNNFASI